MNRDGRMVAAGECGRILERFFRERIDGMRPDGGGDEWVTLPMVDEFLRVVEGLLRRFVVWSGKIDDSFGEHAAHSGFFCHARNGIFEIVHIAIGGRSAAQHFEKTQPRSPNHKILCDVARFGRENIFLEPLVERKIIGNAAEEAHGCVGVAVDQSGHDDATACVDYFRRFVFRFNLG